jgi:hypothetical protein
MYSFIQKNMKIKWQNIILNNFLKKLKFFLSNKKFIYVILDLKKPSYDDK